MDNVYESILKSIEWQLNEFDTIKNDTNNEDDFHTISMLTERRKVCGSVQQAYTMQYKIKRLQDKLDELKDRVDEAVDIVNDYTNGKTKYNVDLVCKKIEIKTLVSTRILSDILTPTEVTYMVNKKLTKAIIKQLNYDDLLYIINSLENNVNKLTGKKKTTLYKSLADSFLNDEKSKYELGISVNIENQLARAKESLDIVDMPRDILEDAYKKLKAWNVLYTMKQKER
jgi:hypothetical protein